MSREDGRKRMGEEGVDGVVKIKLRDKGEFYASNFWVGTSSQIRF